MQHESYLIGQHLPLLLIIVAHHISPRCHFSLVVIETGRSCIVLIIIALNLIQRVPISVRPPHALKIGCVVIVLSGDNLFLGHLRVSRDLAPLHHPPQRVVLLPQLVDPHRELISDRFDKGLRIGSYSLHLKSNGLVLPLQLLQVSQGTVDVILVFVFIDREGYVRGLFAKIRIHNEYYI